MEERWRLKSTDVFHIRNSVCFMKRDNYKWNGSKLKKKKSVLGGKRIFDPPVTIKPHLKETSS